MRTQREHGQEMRAKGQPLARSTARTEALRICMLMVFSPRFGDCGHASTPDLPARVRHAVNGGVDVARDRCAAAQRLEVKAYELRT